MKKLFFMIVACLAFVQAHAATSALVETLLEYQAIIDAIGSNPSFENVIPSVEGIIDIQRITPGVATLGTVKYRIVTSETNDPDGDCRDSKKCRKRCHRRKDTHSYIAELTVAQNPGVGPNIVTVISITQLNH